QDHACPFGALSGPAQIFDEGSTLRSFVPVRIDTTEHRKVPAADAARGFEADVQLVGQCRTRLRAGIRPQRPAKLIEGRVDHAAPFEPTTCQGSADSFLFGPRASPRQRILHAGKADRCGVLDVSERIETANAVTKQRLLAGAVAEVRGVPELPDHAPI